MPDQPIGPILDGLGATINLADGDLVEHAVVLVKVHRADGSVSVALSDSAGMSWLEQLGLVAAAQRIVNNWQIEQPDD